MNIKKLLVSLMVVVSVFALAGIVSGEIKDVLGDEKAPPAKESELMRPFGALKVPADPFFEDFEKEMHQMFDSFRAMPGFGGMQMPDLTRSMHGFNQGRTDVRIEDDNVIVLIDLPGHNKDAIDLRLKGNDLIITSERKSEQSQEEKDKFFRREISYGNFSRVIALPRKVIEAKASAAYLDGVLKVTLPIDKTSPLDEKGYKIPIN